VQHSEPVDQLRECGCNPRIHRVDVRPMTIDERLGKAARPHSQRRAMSCVLLTGYGRGNARFVPGEGTRKSIHLNVLDASCELLQGG
jgi:hypothetical protein